MSRCSCQGLRRAQPCLQEYCNVVCVPVPERNLHAPSDATSEHMNPLNDSRPGTYALVLALEAPVELRIGSLGQIQFDSAFYLYTGSAFGPGGLAARVRHHLEPVRRAHWHIDHLRQRAEVLAVWHNASRQRLECHWAEAAAAYTGTSAVPGFGSSDCYCESHLFAVRTLPSLAAFRRRVFARWPECSSTNRTQLAHYIMT